MNIGNVAQIIGPVVDVQFPEGKVPAIYNALEIELNKKTLVLEVQQHLGDSVVRAVAMQQTDLKEAPRLQIPGLRFLCLLETRF